MNEGGQTLHALPVRRGLKIDEEVLDRHSLVIDEALNRFYAFLSVLSMMFNREI